MGTGKTATAITALRLKCYEAQRQLRTVIFCPPVARMVWARELKAHSKLKWVHVLQGSAKKRLADFREHAYDESKGALGSIFITNYESLMMDELFEALKYWRPEVQIFDESQRVKAMDTKRTKYAIQLADLGGFKLLLSGTPLLNTPMDIWAQYRILDGGESFDKNFYAFRARYFYDKNAGMPSHVKFPDWRPLPGIEQLFNEKIYRKAVRILKKDCLDLPPLVRERVEVELEGEAARMYQAMKKDYVAYLDGKACVASIALTKGLRLQQMVAGFWVDDDGVEHSFKKNPRLDALGDLLEQVAGDHKVIVWTSFRLTYPAISKVCDDLQLPYVMLTGGMTDKARQASIDNFQTDPKVRVMIANAAAGGVGVTLTAASYMIFYSRTFSLEQDLQAEARAHRGGSERHDKITRIDIVAPGTIDELVVDALERKENMAESILRIKEKL